MNRKGSCKQCICINKYSHHLYMMKTVLDTYILWCHFKTVLCITRFECILFLLLYLKAPPGPTPPDKDVIPLCCCKINGASFKKLGSAVTYCQALDSMDGKVCKEI